MKSTDMEEPKEEPEKEEKKDEGNDKFPYNLEIDLPNEGSKKYKLKLQIAELGNEVKKEEPKEEEKKEEEETVDKWSKGR